MSRLKNIFKTFTEKKVIIVGDVMIDTYLNGTVNRVSPEAPVPIVAFKSRENRLGGAANVALNIKALGATPFICSVIGKDAEGELFNRCLHENNLSSKGIIQADGRMTTVKTRVLGNNQQLVRIDNEQTDPITSSTEFALVEKVKQIALTEKVDAIIFEDYNKGVLTPFVIEKLIDFANENAIISTVDPKLENFFCYKNVTLFKPNLKELKEGVGKRFEVTNQVAFLEAVEVLKKQLNPVYTFVTLSEHGVFITHKNENHFIPAHLRDITDVSGAGDTVISVATLCLVSGLEAKYIAEIANLAGGLVCEKVGVSTVDREQLVSEALSL